MTYKNAVAGLNLGGGKSVIIGDNSTREPRDDLPRARPVRRSRSAAATSPPRTSARAPPTWTSCTWRPSTSPASPAGRAIRRPVTAHGVFRAIQASAKERWGSRRPARARRSRCRAAATSGYYLVQGAARGGREAHRHRHRRRAREARGERVRRATAVAPTTIYGVQADIFAPCALGAVINDETIPQLKVRDRGRRARTTSCSRSGTATRSRSAASSTRPTTWPTPAA